MNKYIVTSICFILIIGIMFFVTLWNNKGEIVRGLLSGDRIANINEIYNRNLAFSEKFLKLWSATQNSIGAELLDDAEYGHLIKDDTGNVYFPADDVDVTKYAEMVKDFSNKVKEKGMKFVYIQAPNKAIKGYSSETVFAYNFSNKNADELIELLKKNDVDTFDLRKILKSSGIPVDKMFYKSDHHWTTPTAFWAFNQIVSYLKNNCGLVVDEKYLDINNYKVTEFEDCFLGSLGRRVGADVTGYDDYTFIEPNFDTSYEITNGITKTIVGTGDFHNAIVKEHILNSKDKEANKHSTYFEWDYGNLIIKNKNVDNDYKLLLIKDSYALPVTAFLSTCISEIHMVDLRDTPTVNLEKYIENNTFDAVVMLYNTEVFNDTMFNFSK